MLKAQKYTGASDRKLNTVPAGLSPSTLLNGGMSKSWKLNR